MSDITYATASKQYRTGHYTASLATLNKLLDLQRDARTYTLLAKTLIRLGLKSEAASSYQLAAEQGGADADENLVESIKLFYECEDKDRALALTKRLVHKTHKYPEVAYIMSSILVERKQASLARPFKDALMKSDNIEYMKMGARIALHTWDLFDPADVETARLLMSKLPRNNRIRLMYMAFCREHGRYEAIERHLPIIQEALANGENEFIRGDGPFFNLTWCGDEHINQIARSNTPIYHEQMPKVRRKQPHDWTTKIRVGYVSSDLFDQHATMKLIRQVFELHDRAKFDVTLFCHTDPKLLAENNTTDRTTWGDIVSIRDMTDEEAADAIRERGIDILVDLKGHTVGNRTALFNRGLAPVQVAWLGFPGSTLNVDLDYVIGDKYVLQDSSKPHYHEKFCRLPDTYQPNDALNRPLAVPMTRAELGLPEDAFVLASFNANRKVSLPVIELWAEILNRIPNSVIWMMRNGRDGDTHIIKKFMASGVSAKRVFLMPKVDFAQHLNRIPAADLGLDTFPYNGHTTTSEQLWSGLPVLAVKGTNFASRVSESLLNAIGMPELVAADTNDYIKKAVEYAGNPDMLTAFRARIEENRFKLPLFDAERLCRHLETAYEMMADKARNGLEPDHIDVPPLPARTKAFM